MPESAETSESGIEQVVADERAGKYLLFRLDHGEFGVPINKVREVMEMQDITRVPNSPVLIAGVINLRGKVIPVVDLRLTFELPASLPTPETCIVIVRITLASVEQTLGLLVDAVTEVLHLHGPEFLRPEELHPSGDRQRHDAPYLLGVARVANRIKVLLDLDEVLNNLELRKAPALATAA